MSNLERIRNEWLASENEEIENKDHHTTLETVHLYADELMDIWISENPAPKIDIDNFHSCVDRAMWGLENHEAMRFFNDDEMKIHVPAYRWNIEQAIINRNGGSMMSSAIEYVEGLCS